MLGVSFKNNQNRRFADLPLPTEDMQSDINVVKTILPKKSMDMFEANAVNNHPKARKGDDIRMVFLRPNMADMVPPQGIINIPTTGWMVANHEPSSSVRVTPKESSSDCSLGRAMVGKPAIKPNTKYPRQAPRDPNT